MNLSKSQESQDYQLENKKTLYANDEIALNKILNINLLMSVIFSYFEFKDFITFSTVCKKWYLLANPFIHKRIKLLRSTDARKERYYDESLKIEDQIDAEVEECICSNSKYAHYIKELTYSKSLKPQRAIEFFETFKYITNLKVYDVNISQDQFICMIKPLNKLEELNLSSVTIKEIKRKRLYKESIQLPQTLIKLSLFDLKLVGNPALFVQTMNSHSSLKGFIFNSGDESSFLTPFFTRYPSLEFFKYNNRKSKNHQPLIKVFESNPQILILKLDCSLLGSLASHIGLNLSNLKEFELSGSLNFVPDNAYFFSQPIKIKKLKLTVRVLTSSLLNSLLQSCSELEEFIYEPGGLFSLKNMSAKVEKPTKIKKLRIPKDTFDDSSFNSIILNCPYLEDMDIVFPGEWKGYRDIISQRCTNLKSLTLYNFIENVCHIEYISLEFLSRNCAFKNTLTSLTLENFPFRAINSVHLQDYSNLKAIKFRSYHIDYEKNIEEVLNNNELWSNYLKIPIRGNNMYGKTFLKYI